MPLNGKAAWMAMEQADLDSAEEDLDFILAIGTDERLLRRLNDIDFSETCSTSGRATEAKWQLDPAQSIDVLRQLAKASQSTSS
jgi:trehalose 6-phosphate synthase/phosphatase